MIKNIFKYAAKKRLRFPYKGLLSVEDLFNLSLEELNEVYKTLKGCLHESINDSLIVEKTDKDRELEVMISIVMEIFDDKKKAIDKEQKRSQKKIQAQKILEIMNKKQDEELLNLTSEELKQKLEELSDDETLDDED